MKKKYVFKKDPNKKYDEEVITTAKRRVTIILVVVAYIIYQLYQVVANKIAGTNPMTWTGVILACVLVGGCSIGVFVYSVLRMGQDIAEAEIDETAEIEE